MRVLMLAVNDPAGCVILLCDALNRYTDVSARLLTLETRYTHNFRKDMHIPDCGEEQLAEAERLLQQADVLHFHMTCDEDTPFGPFIPRNYMRGKAIVHHHHGHPDFRACPQIFRRKYQQRDRRNLLVSTPDLLRLLPEARWQPNAVPETDDAYRPKSQPRLQTAPVRIGHSPTRKDIKNTAEFVAVLEALSRAPDLPRTEMVLMDDIPHAQCLRLKQTTDIFFDHIQGYFGMSSLEALSQGIPTLAGLDAWNKAHVEAFAGLPSPWVWVHDQESLYRRLRELILDPDQRQALGAQSRTFIEHGWNAAKVARHMVDFYTMLT